MPYGRAARAFIARLLYEAALRIEERQEASEREYITYKNGRKYINSWRAQNAPEKQRHPSEEQHRSNEERNWAFQNALTGVAIFLTMIVGVFTVGTFYETRRQADAASRSYLFSEAIDKGTIYNWLLNNGLMSEGLVATNYGSSTAIVRRVGCLIVWGSKASPPPGSVKIAAEDNHQRALDAFGQYTMPSDSIIMPDKQVSFSCPDAYPTNDYTMRGHDPKTTPPRFLFGFSHSIWIVAMITYTDLSGYIHHTPLCSRWTGSRLDDGGGEECTASD